MLKSLFNCKNYPIFVAVIKKNNKQLKIGEKKWLNVCMWNESTLSNTHPTR